MTLGISKVQWLLTRSFTAAAVFARYPKVQFGKWPRVDGLWPILDAEGDLSFGDNMWFRAPTQRIEVTACHGASIEIGDNSFINNGASIRAWVGITIGRAAKIADGVAIYDTNFHQLEEGAPTRSERVTIGENVWIARNSIILPGVTIGSNSVIAAGSVVRTAIPPNTLAAGNPARSIKSLRASSAFVRK